LLSIPNFIFSPSYDSPSREASANRPNYLWLNATFKGDYALNADDSDDTFAFLYYSFIYYFGGVIGSFSEFMLDKFLDIITYRTEVLKFLSNLFSINCHSD
jgi:hypothetical protein